MVTDNHEQGKPWFGHVRPSREFMTGGNPVGVAVAHNRQPSREGSGNRNRLSNFHWRVANWLGGKVRAPTKPYRNRFREVLQNSRLRARGLTEPADSA